MSRLKRNILANFAGQGWSALAGLIFVPLYIKFMGIEAYGLIGFHVALQSMFSLLDFGLSPTMNREMARYSVQPEKAGEARDLVRTLEVGYWVIGVVIGMAVLAAAPFIATYWVKAKSTPVGVIQEVVRIMGLVIAVQWPLSLYQGGLLGLQKQIWLNSLSAGMAALRSGGAVLILWLVSPTIIAFFVWQIVVSAVQVVLTRFLLWRSLPLSDHIARFEWGLLAHIWRFAAGMSVASLMALFRSQLAMLILSKLLSLEMFGYYTLASTLGNALSRLSSPIFTAIFPGLSTLAAQGDDDGLKALYHRSCQLVSVIVLPPALMIIFFTHEVLGLWTWDEMTARMVAPIVRIFVIGTALNSLAGLPYDVQIACGWTKLAVYKSIVAIVMLTPATFFLATHYGAVGAAMTWVILNSGYVLIEVPIMHHRLLRGEMLGWYVEDVGVPLAVTLAIIGVGRWLMPQSLDPLGTVLGLAVVSVTALASCAFSAPHIRTWILGLVRVLRTAHRGRHAI